MKAITHLSNYNTSSPFNQLVLMLVLVLVMDQEALSRDS